MDFSVKQITSNSLHMTSMFSSIQGYSGTIDNVLALPHNLVEKALNERKNNEKNNGGIAIKLIQHFNNAAIPALNEQAFLGNADTLIMQLFDAFKDFKDFERDRVSAIIDTGAFFKNFNNRQVSEAILELFKGKIRAVLFYDEESNQLKFIRGAFKEARLISIATGPLETTDLENINKVTQVDINERFTFYDQRHITGSDILQPKSARAIMTVSSRILLREILQGTLRMRQFMTSQKVHLLSTLSVQKFYNSKVKKNLERLFVSDILTLAALNEDQKQEQENQNLAFRKIDTEIRSFLLDEINKVLLESPSNNVDVERINSLISVHDNLFVRKMIEDPITWLFDKEPKDTQIILDEHAKSRLNILKPLFQKENNRLQVLSEKIDSILSSLLNLLKPKISAYTNISAGKEVLLKNEVSILAFADLDIDSYTQTFDSAADPVSYRYENLLTEIKDKCGDCGVIQNDSTGFLNFNTLFSLDNPEASNIRSILLSDGHRIGVTKDLVKLQLHANDDDEYPIFSNFTREGTHLLIYKSPKQLDNPLIFLLSPEHASQAYKQISEHELDAYFWLCDLAGDVRITNFQCPNTVKNILKRAEFGEDFKRAIFDLLIFNGSLPQVLDNIELKNIYDNEWLGNTNFSNLRAIFLRIRMNVLGKKNLIIFVETDQEYSKLKGLSLNHSSENHAFIRTNIYSKGPVSVEMQSDFEELNHESFGHGSFTIKRVNQDFLENTLKILFKKNNASEVQTRREEFKSYNEGSGINIVKSGDYQTFQVPLKHLETMNLLKLTEGHNEIIVAEQNKKETEKQKQNNITIDQGTEINIGEQHEIEPTRKTKFSNSLLALTILFIFCVILCYAFKLFGKKQIEPSTVEASVVERPFTTETRFADFTLIDNE